LFDTPFATEDTTGRFPCFYGIKQLFSGYRQYVRYLEILEHLISDYQEFPGHIVYSYSIVVHPIEWLFLRPMDDEKHFLEIDYGSTNDVVLQRLSEAR